MTHKFKNISLDDLHVICVIENESFQKPWKYLDFLKQMKAKDSDNKVILIDNQIIGYMFAEIEEDKIYIANMAIKEGHRRKKYGTEILNYLKARLEQCGKNTLYASVRETDLPLQMFFKNNGFLYIETLRDLYDDVKEDVYIFEYVRRVKKNG